MTQNNPAPCPGREETIYLFLDDALNPIEQAAFLTHLQTCTACQSLLAQLTDLFTELTALPEITAPPELASQVMARLPAQSTPARRVTLGQLALIGQVVMGLALLLIFAPVITASLENPLLWQPWFSLSDMFISLLTWLRELAADIVAQAQTQWPPRMSWLVFSLSPLWLGEIIAGLGLAWLIGNGLLLRRHPTSFKNGGAS